MNRFAFPLLLGACAFLGAACSDDPPPAPPKPAAEAPKPPAPVAAAKPAPEPAKPEPRADPDKALAQQVKKALEERSAEIAGAIDVSAEGGKVRLWGTVGTAKDRENAARIAAATPGVSAVENKIVVVKGS